MHIKIRLIYILCIIILYYIILFKYNLLFYLKFKILCIIDFINNLY